MGTGELFICESTVLGFKEANVPITYFLVNQISTILSYWLVVLIIVVPSHVILRRLKHVRDGWVNESCDRFMLDNWLLMQRDAVLS